jgi:hypothetical protein
MSETARKVRFPPWRKDREAALIAMAINLRTAVRASGGRACRHANYPAFHSSSHCHDERLVWLSFPPGTSPAPRHRPSTAGRPAHSARLDSERPRRRDSAVSGTGYRARAEFASTARFRGVWTVDGSASRARMEDDSGRQGYEAAAQRTQQYWNGLSRGGG